MTWHDIHATCLVRDLQWEHMGSRIRIKVWYVVDHCLVFPINSIIITLLLSYSSIFYYVYFLLPLLSLSYFCYCFCSFTIIFNITSSLLYFIFNSFLYVVTWAKVLRKQPLYFHEVGVGLHRYYPPQTWLVGVHWVCCCSGMKSSWFILNEDLTESYIQ